jgi:hypothetical protein
MSRFTHSTSLLLRCLRSLAVPAVSLFLFGSVVAGGPRSLIYSLGYPRLALTLGLDPNAKLFAYSLLAEAISGDKPDWQRAELLFRNGARLHREDFLERPYSWSPPPNRSAVALLVKLGFDPNLQYQGTALVGQLIGKASPEMRPELLTEFLEQGFQPARHDIRPLLRVLLTDGQVDWRSAAVLVAKGGRLTAGQFSSLRYSIKLTDRSSIRTLIDAGVDLTDPERNPLWLLTDAPLSHRVEMLDEMLDQGLVVDPKGERNVELMIAALTHGSGWWAEALDLFARRLAQDSPATDRIALQFLHRVLQTKKPSAERRVGFRGQIALCKILRAKPALVNHALFDPAARVEIDREARCLKSSPDKCLDSLADLQVPRRDPRDYEIKLHSAGDPNVGTIYFLRQIHKVVTPDHEGKLVKHLSLGERMVTGVHQLAIGSAVSKLQADAIFDEGNSRPQPIVETFHPTVESALCDALENGTHVPLLLENLHQRGGADAASACYAVPIYGTQTESTSARVDAYLAHQLRFPSQAAEDRFVFDERETEALLQVKAYMDEKPGRKVALVFGAAHSFRRERVEAAWGRNSQLPIVYSVSFPSAANFETSVSQGLPARVQRNTAQKAEFLPFSAIWAFDDPAARRVALAKIDPLSLSSRGDLTELAPRPASCVCQWSNQQIYAALRPAQDEDAARTLAAFDSTLSRQLALLKVENASMAEITNILQRPLTPVLQYEIVQRARAIGPEAMPWIVDYKAQIAALSKVKGSCQELRDLRSAMEAAGTFVSQAFAEEFIKFKKKLGGCGQTAARHQRLEPGL